MKGLLTEHGRHVIKELAYSPSSPICCMYFSSSLTSSSIHLSASSSCSSSSLSLKAEGGGGTSVFWNSSLQPQRSVRGTLFFWQMHQPLLQSPLQLQDTNSTSPSGAILPWLHAAIKIPFPFISQPWKRWSTVIVIDKFTECYTANGQLTRFKC